MTIKIGKKVIFRIAHNLDDQLGYCVVARVLQIKDYSVVVRNIYSGDYHEVAKSQIEKYESKKITGRPMVR